MVQLMAYAAFRSLLPDCEQIEQSLMQSDSYSPRVEKDIAGSTGKSNSVASVTNAMSCRGNGSMAAHSGTCWMRKQVFLVCCGRESR